MVSIKIALVAAGAALLLASAVGSASAQARTQAGGGFGRTRDRHRLQLDRTGPVVNGRRWHRVGVSHDGQGYPCSRSPAAVVVAVTR